MFCPWKVVGINYIRYSNICARIVRKGLKPEARAEAKQRDISHIRCVHWTNGAPWNQNRDEL